jgi:hypothetical protein
MKKLSRLSGFFFPLFILSAVLFADESFAQLRNNSGSRTAPTKAATGAVKKTQPASSRSQSVNRSPQSGRNPGNAAQNSSERRVGDNNIKAGNNTNINSGNRNVNIDNSRDVNINVENNRTTVVRRNTYRPYTRPPYVYGGRSYYCYHPYYYHPYRPFYWGPAYHPWGFFVATLATTAIIVSVNNQKYHYDNGVYYVQSGSGYTVVQAPVGATVTTLPPASQTVVINETTNNYYYGGTYYEKSEKGYTVVPPTAGTVVESLPEGGEEVKVGDQTYVKVGDTYYQPMQQDGKNMYEVVQIEDGK